MTAVPSTEAAWSASAGSSGASSSRQRINAVRAVGDRLVIAIAPVVA